MVSNSPSTMPFDPDTLFHDDEGHMGPAEREWWLNNWWAHNRVKVPTEAMNKYFYFVETRRGYFSRYCEGITFADLKALQRVICNNSSANRKTLIDLARPLIRHNDCSVSQCLSLVVQLYLMVSIDFEGRPSEGRPFNGLEILEFPDEATFQDIIQRFQQTRVARDIAEIESFPGWFDIVDLERTTGLEVVLVDFLNDHLQISNGRLYIFGNIGALSKVCEDPRYRPIFTDSFIDETERSVMLFFPSSSQGHYDRWFKKNYSSMSVRSVTRFPGYPSRSAIDFPVWKNSLTHIAKYSNTEGAWSFKRWWYDGRDEALWWTRWSLLLALSLTVLFGLIQSITGIMQVYYATHPQKGL